MTYSPQLCPDVFPSNPFSFSLNMKDQASHP